MSRPSAVKHPRTTASLAALLLLCTVVLVACGSSKSPTTSVASNPSTSTSATDGSTTAATTTGSTGTKAAGSTQSKQTGAGHSGTTSTGATSTGASSTGKSSTGGAPPAATSTETSSVRQCLERNGIKSHPSGKAPTRAQLNAALAHCATPLTPPRSSSQTSAVRRRLLAQPSYRQALARFSSCMRAHGVPNFPDANTSGKGPLYPSGSVKPTPKVREAQKACIGELRLR